MARVSVEALIAEYRSGRSIRQVAETYHIPESTVVNKLKRAGEPRRRQGRQRSAVEEALREIQAMKETTP